MKDLVFCLFKSISEKLKLFIKGCKVEFGKRYRLFNAVITLLMNNYILLLLNLR